MSGYRKSPRPRVTLRAPCGKEFDGDPAAVKRLRADHEARCRDCRRERETDGTPAKGEEE